MIFTPLLAHPSIIARLSHSPALPTSRLLLLFQARLNKAAAQQGPQGAQGEQGWRGGDGASGAQGKDGGHGKDGGKGERGERGADGLSRKQVEEVVSALSRQQLEEMLAQLPPSRYAEGVKALTISTDQNEGKEEDQLHQLRWAVDKKGQKRSRACH